jgi:PAS domain S-box-containing protein
LLLLSLIWQELTLRHETSLRNHFTIETQRLTSKIDERMAAYAQILRSGAGLFAASDGVSRTEWRRFYEKLDLGQSYRGIQGIGFARYIPRRQLAAHLKTLRREGFPDYAVRPPGERETYSSIVYLEPFSGPNLRAFGYDMFSEPVRQAAMVTARDRDDVAFSGKVTLVQEAGERIQAGFLAYHPIYRGDSQPVDIEQRRRDLIGWVYSPYRADDLLEPILHDQLGPIRLEIFDGNTLTPETLLFDSASSFRQIGVEAASNLSRTVPLDLPGRRWTLRYTALPEFASMTKFEQPWVEMTGIGLITILLLLVSWALINTRQRAEQIALQLSSSSRTNEVRLQRILDDMPVAVCLVDGGGAIYFRNRRFLDAFGYDEKTVPTLKEWWRVAYPDPQYRETALKTWHIAVAHAAENGCDIEPIEYQIASHDGQKRDFLVSGIALDTHFIATFVDLTERKQYERELTQARNAAETASRAKSEFVANMSHEIRTPMSAVLGLLQLLQHTELNELQLDYTQKAQGAAQSLLAILNDILDFSKVEAGKLVLDDAPFRLDELLRNLAVVLSSAVGGKPVEVLFEVDPALPRALRGDPLRLQQVLLNLAGNAIKFTKHGEVVIAMHVRQETEQAVEIEFAVRDTGIGIPSDRLNAIFEGFAQAEASTARNYGGTGLGLAISQRLVQLMGGELKVDSAPGQGSRFHFRLKFNRDAETLATDQAARHALDPDSLPTPLRVLVVDDNATARDVLTSMTRAFGWETVAVDSGMAAVERIRQESAAGRRYDVICIDWVMPGMDGWETIQQIRAQQPENNAPVILMVTAHGRDKLDAKLNGTPNPLQGYLVKPVTPSTLFDAVAGATRGHSVTIERPSAPRATAALEGLHLLLVDDNLLNQRVARELLTHAGARVDVANDGPEGIAAVRAKPDFDAILMDIQMPGMDGYQTTHVLRTEMGVTLPIIAMTANALPSDRAACLAAGMDDHVGKPIHVAGLIATLLKHCHRATDHVLPAATARLDDLPPLPSGFELAPALERLNQDRALFARLARDFVREQDGLLSRISRRWQDGDTAAATRELHTLKGLAASLGAMALAAVAAATETELKQLAPRALIDEPLDRLHPSLSTALAVLQELADAIEPVPAAPVQPHPENNFRLLDLLHELDTLLATRNMRAIDINAALQEEARGIADDSLAALDAAVGQLDFAAARTQVAALISLLSP